MNQTLTYEEAQAAFETRAITDYREVIRAAQRELDRKVASLGPVDRAEWNALLVANEFYDGEVEIQLSQVEALILRSHPQHQPGRPAGKVWSFGPEHSRCRDCGRSVRYDGDGRWFHR